MGPPVSRTSSAGMLVAYWSLIVDQQLTRDLFSQQLLSNNEASKAFGGILAIPDLVGNLGLGCTVSFGPWLDLLGCGSPFMQHSQSASVSEVNARALQSFAVKCKPESELIALSIVADANPSMSHSHSYQKGLINLGCSPISAL